MTRNLFTRACFPVVVRLEAATRCSPEGPTWQWQPLGTCNGELRSEQTLPAHPAFRAPRKGLLTSLSSKVLP